MLCAPLTLTCPVQVELQDRKLNVVALKWLLLASPVIEIFRFVQLLAQDVLAYTGERYSLRIGNSLLGGIFPKGVVAYITALRGES